MKLNLSFGMYSGVILIFLSLYSSSHSFIWFVKWVLMPLLSKYLY
mgnify:CR=1 FL=1